MRALPPSLLRRSDVDAIHEDIRPYLGTTVAERAEIVSSLCRLAAEQIEARRDGDRVLCYREPPAPSYLPLWRRLVRDARGC